MYKAARDRLPGGHAVRAEDDPILAVRRCKSRIFRRRMRPPAGVGMVATKDSRAARTGRPVRGDEDGGVDLKAGVWRGRDISGGTDVPNFNTFAQ